MTLRKLFPLAALFLGIQSAYSAQYDEQQASAILAEIDSNGAAPVLINLFDSSLHELLGDPQALKEKSAVRSGVLLGELSGGYWSQGKWESGLGQLRLYVNRNGLEKLKQSDNALSFAPADSWRTLTLLDNRGGALDRIESRLREQESVEVEAVLNVDGLDYRLKRDGTYEIVATPEKTFQTASLAAAVTARLGQAKAAATLSAATPVARLKIGYADFIELAQNENVRSLRLVDDAGPAAPSAFPALSVKSVLPGGNEKIRVIVQIRNPLLSGRLSPSSYEIARRENENALREIFAEAGIDKAGARFPGIGAAQLELDQTQYQRLLNLQDKRIADIVPDAIVARAKLNVSGPSQGVPLAWAEGYSGKGQMIAVLDTGLQLNHETFRDAQGNSRIRYQGCFGTNAEGFSSVCPQQNAQGDSPFELPGSGSYYDGPGSSDSYEHGTHVAGIAAGSSPQYTGVAPEADLVAAQVFSYHPAEGSAVFMSDLLTVFETGVSESRYSSTFPLTVNMSLGGETAFLENCDPYYPSFAIYVQLLKAKQIPVVVASGNEYFRYGLTFPSCVSHTIKVGSLANDGNLRRVSAFGNLGPQANFTGPFFLAPGEGVTSAVPLPGSDAGYASFNGTSMAAPQVAGLYALAKSALPDYTIDQITAWIQANFTQQLSVWILAVVSGSTPGDYRYIPGYETFNVIKIQ